MNVTVPLFQIPVGNLTLSNQLSNSALGFKPTGDESMYGLHWYSNQFGSITRDSKKDFLLTKFSAIQAENGVAGIYASDESKDKERNDCTVQRQKFNYGFVSSKKQILQNPTNSGIQGGFNPDKFYFDFFGYKGYFTFDNYGNPLVFCENGKLKVLIPSADSSKCYWVNSPIDFQNKNITEIKMIDDKGNTFYFGGTYDDLEVNYSQYNFSGIYYNPFFQSNSSFYSGSRANYIISWFLKKVELNNGDIIEAQYKHGNSDIYNSFTQESLVNQNSSFPTDYPTSAQREAANVEVSSSYEILPSSNDLLLHFTIKNETKRAILENIKIIGKDITINYNYFRDSNRLLHISKINLTYFGKSEDIIFNQTALGGQNYRYFLTSLSTNGKLYSFDYYNTENLPDKKLKGINDFGFWNGTNFKGAGNSNTVLDVTLLKKIIYPSKGYTIFNREKADVSKRNLGGVIDYELASTNASMSRIANKIEFDGSKEYITNYTYTLNNGKSSGILDFTIIQGKIRNQAIKYSQVQENIVNKGEVDYFYTDLLTNPDDNSIKKFTASNGSNSLYFNDENNREYQQGKLIKKTIYDSNNNLLKEHQYEYQSFLRPENELADLSGTGCSTCKVSDDNYYVLTDIDRSYNQNHAVTRYEPVIPYLLNKEKVIEYLEGKQISTETNIKYRESNLWWHPYPVQIENNTTTGTSIKKYLYAYDLFAGNCRHGACPVNENIVGGQYPTYASMYNSNIMFPLIEISKNEYNKYSLQENLFYAPPFVPKKVRQSKLDATLDFTNYNITVDKTVNGTSYDLLDNKANYLQTTDKSDVSTVIIYGYKQTLPIAKITGVTYTQLMQILGQPSGPNDYLNLDIVTKSDSDIDAASEQNLINALNILRSNVLLKDYPITTYTYNPLIGVTSITPPSGIREVYLYDSANRLKEIREDNATGKILKEFKYNYKQ